MKTLTCFNATCDFCTQYWDRKNRKRWRTRPWFEDEARDLFVSVADEDDAADQMNDEMEEVCDEIEGIPELRTQLEIDQTEMETEIAQIEEDMEKGIEMEIAQDLN